MITTVTTQFTLEEYQIKLSYLSALKAFWKLAGQIWQSKL